MYFYRDLARLSLLVRSKENLDRSVLDSFTVGEDKTFTRLDLLFRVSLACMFHVCLPACTARRQTCRFINLKCLRREVAVSARPRGARITGAGLGCEPESGRERVVDARMACTTLQDCARHNLYPIMRLAQRILIHVSKVSNASRRV